MLDRLTRYMIRQTVWPLLMVSFVLAGIIWLTQSLRMLDLIINQGQTFGIFLKMTLLFQSGIVAIILPIALFIAVLYCLQRLILDSELVVVFAAGVGRWRIAKPFLIVAGGTAVTVALFNVWLMPLGLREFRDQLTQIRAEVATAMVRAGDFANPIDGLTVYVRQRSSNDEVRGVLVQDARKEKEAVTFIAETGNLVTSDGRPRLVMYNGSIQRNQKQSVSEDKDPVTYLFFDQYTFDLAQFTPQAQKMYYEPRERYLEELFSPAADDYYANEKPQELLAEGHDRLASILYPFTLTLIALAALLPAPFSRRGYTKRILTAALCGAAVRIAGFGIANAIVVAPAVWPIAYLLPVVAGALATWELTNTGLTRFLARAGHLFHAPTPKERPGQ